MKCTNCGAELAPEERFCGECGAARPQLPPRFAEAEQRFAELRARYQAGELDDAAYEAELQKLVVEDSSGGHWMLGADSGEWYWYDGQQWVRRDPPLAGVAVERSQVRPAPPPTAAPPTPAAALAKEPILARMQVLSLLLLITIGWAIGWAIGLGIGFSIGETVGAAIGAAIGGAVGGLLTGLALRQTEPSIQWEQVLMMTIGWAIGGAIGGVIGWVGGVIGWVGLASYRAIIDRAIVWTISWAIGLGIGGAIGGLITGLALRRVELSNQWKQVLMVAIGWAIGLAIGGAIIGRAIGLALRWAIFGQAIASEHIGLAIIGGAIGGAIGGGVTFWRLSRARRRG